MIFVKRCKPPRSPADSAPTMFFYRIIIGTGDDSTAAISFDCGGEDAQVER
jgi:hypothetical protein